MSTFSQKLEVWYNDHKRALPWRNTADPYRIWISEIILQQTRVNQGYDYYQRFIQQFPTVRALADSSEDSVLRAWQGLGYYSRARNLHMAAKQIVQHGSFPTTYAEVRALRGIGDYTAAAICSIAFNLPYPVIDGNVYRVLSRYFAIDTPIDTAQGKRLFAQLADKMMDKKHPGEYNQAIMDFGATHCTPQNPSCETCIYRDQCLAYARQEVKNFPVKSHRTKVRDRYFIYIYIKTPHYTFLWKRSQSDIWQGLYEPLLLEFDTPPTDEQILNHPVPTALLRQPGASLRLITKEVIHLLSHQRLHARFCEIHLSAEPADNILPAGSIAIEEADMEQFATPTLVRNLLALR